MTTQHNTTQHNATQHNHPNVADTIAYALAAFIATRIREATGEYPTPPNHIHIPRRRTPTLQYKGKVIQ